MSRYIISSLIAFLMVASFMLFWSPLTETALASDGPVCPPLAICACAGKWTGNMRNVPCDCKCDCSLSTSSNPVLACEPHRCSRKENPLVLEPYPYINVDDDGTTLCVAPYCGHGVDEGCTDDTDCCEDLVCGTSNTCEQPPTMACLVNGSECTDNVECCSEFCSTAGTCATPL